MSDQDDSLIITVREVYLNPPTDNCMTNLNRDYKRWLALYYDGYGYFNSFISREEIVESEPDPQEYNENC